MGIGDRASRLGPTRAALAACAVCAAAFLAPAPAAAASAEASPGLGFSAGTWSFSRPVGEARAPEGRAIEEGLYARAGAIAGIAPRLELEAFAIGSLAPAPGRDLFLGAEATIPLLGPRGKSYFNMLASLGYMQGLRLEGGAEPAGSYLTARLAPLAIGNPSYRRRSRLFAIGALYELASGEVSLTFSVLSLDFF